MCMCGNLLAGETSVTGTYADSEGNRITLKQKGTKVSGQAGEVGYSVNIKGKINGDTLELDLFAGQSANVRAGKVFLGILSDGNRLVGSVKYMNSWASSIAHYGKSWDFSKLDSDGKIVKQEVQGSDGANQNSEASLDKTSADAERLQADIDRLASEMNKLAEEKRKFEEEKKKQTKVQQVLMREMIAAENGNAQTQMKLGDRYISGDGVEQDASEAFHWYSKAAKQGVVLAQLYVGNMYLKGQGITQNNSKAVEWLDKAAKQGNEEAKDSILEARYKLSLEKRQNEKMAEKRAEEERIAAEQRRKEEKRRAEAQAQAEAYAKAKAKAQAEARAKANARAQTNTGVYGGANAENSVRNVSIVDLADCGSGAIQMVTMAIQQGNSKYANIYTVISQDANKVAEMKGRADKEIFLNIINSNSAALRYTPAAEQESMLKVRIKKCEQFLPLFTRLFH